MGISIVVRSDHHKCMEGPVWLELNPDKIYFLCTPAYQLSIELELCEMILIRSLDIWKLNKNEVKSSEQLHRLLQKVESMSPSQNTWSSCDK